MSEEDRDDAVRVHTVVCHNHLRDTMLRHRIKEELKDLKETLAEALEEVRAEERVTLDVQVICRAAAKEFLFSASGIYLDFEATAAGSGPAGEVGDGDDAEECGDGNGGDEEDENDEEDEEDEDSD